MLCEPCPLPEDLLDRCEAAERGRIWAQQCAVQIGRECSVVRDSAKAADEEQERVKMEAEDQQSRLAERRKARMKPLINRESVKRVLLENTAHKEWCTLREDAKIGREEAAYRERQRHIAERRTLLVTEDEEHALRITVEHDRTTLMTSLAYLLLEDRMDAVCREGNARALNRKVVRREQEIRFDAAVAEHSEFVAIARDAESSARQAVCAEVDAAVLFLSRCNEQLVTIRRLFLRVDMQLTALQKEQSMERMQLQWFQEETRGDLTALAAEDAACVASAMLSHA